MRKASKVLVLTGGLGNQLFQLAAGLSVSSPTNLVINCKFGRPRLNHLGQPDLNSFAFQSELSYSLTHSDSRFRAFLGSLAFKISSKRFANSLLQKTWILLKRSMNCFGVFLSDGVGYDYRLSVSQNARWIFGPFHTYKYLQNDQVREFFSAITLRNYPDWLGKLQIAAVNEQPIVLHVRLSDYLNISELGILNYDYFCRALHLAQEKFPGSRIWLFTDDEALALELLGPLLQKDVRIINYDQTDSASNLEAMRFGVCYILSNSTFSWWGAYLSHSSTPLVFCPTNWFKTKENPLHLLPLDWIKVANT